jgi:short-subunit dehydrogenase
MVYHALRQWPASEVEMKHFYQGKTIVITGASSGIGKDLAVLLSSYGSRLALIARRRAMLEEVRAECEQQGGEAVVFEGDVTSDATMTAMRDAVLARWGFADIVVANAGVGGLNPGTSFSLEVNRRFVEVNLIGLANTLVPFIPSMLERRQGQLVGISSLAAFRGLPKAASYSSTKAAQATFCESLRVDLRPHGIAVTCIHPGFIETPMTDHHDFRMPFMVPVRKSSLLVARAIMKRRRVYLYPWPMRILTWFNRHLPRFLYDRLMPRLSGQRDDVTAKTF